MTLSVGPDSDRAAAIGSVEIAGTSTAAQVLRELVHPLASVVAAPSSAVPAAARWTHPDGVASAVEVDWSSPVGGGGVVDEATAQAVCGAMAVHGRKSGRPTGLCLDYCATAAGVLAATGLTAGMLGALRGGSFTTVRTSVAHAALLSVSQYLAAAGAPEDESSPLQPGGPPFNSADGISFELEMLDPTAWAAFWARLGAPTASVRAGWLPFQFRYATATAPLPEALYEITSRLPFAELTQAAVETSASICPLASQVDRATELDLPDGVPSAWELTGLPGTGSFSAGFRPKPGALPLEGMVVLEAGRRIQAPMAAHLLGLLGATVLRIEPPGGDPLRGMPPVCGANSARWLALNRGKDAVEIDIKDPAGRRKLRELVADADVFLHNWAPGKAERLGLGAADLATVNSGLVYAYTSGWADRLADPPLGTDFMVQARTGLGEALRPADEAPAPSLMTVIDVLGGLLGAHALTAALLHRHRTGRGVAVQSSLVAAADLLQLPALRALAAGGDGHSPTGFRRPLATADGWCAPADEHAIAAAACADHLRALPTGEAVALLAGRGVHATPVITDLADLPRDPRFADAVRLDADQCPAVATPWRFA
jgi:CoA:oxalate CoA-transferase